MPSLLAVPYGYLGYDNISLGFLHVRRTTGVAKWLLETCALKKGETCSIRIGVRALQRLDGELPGLMKCHWRGNAEQIESTVLGLEHCRLKDFCQIWPSWEKDEGSSNCRQSGNNVRNIP